MSVRAEYKRALWIISAVLNVIWWSALILRHNAPLQGSISAPAEVDLMCHGLSASRVGAGRHGMTRLWWSCHARSLSSDTTADMMRQSRVERSGRQSPLGDDWEPVIALLDVRAHELTYLIHGGALDRRLTLYTLPSVTRERSEELLNSSRTPLPELWDSYGVAYARLDPPQEGLLQEKSLPENPKSEVSFNIPLRMPIRLPSKQARGHEHWIFAHRLSDEGEIAILTPNRIGSRDALRARVRQSQRQAQHVEWSTLKTLTTIPSSERLLALRADVKGWTVWSRELNTTYKLVRRSGSWRTRDVVIDDFPPPHVRGAMRTVTPFGVSYLHESARVIWRSGDRLTLGTPHELGEQVTLSLSAQATLRDHPDLTQNSLLSSGGVRPWITRAVPPWRWGEHLERLDHHPSPQRCLDLSLMSSLDERSGEISSGTPKENDVWGAVSAQTRPHLTWDRDHAHWRFAPLSDIHIDPLSKERSSACAWRSDQRAWVYPGRRDGALRWIPLGEGELSSRARGLWVNDAGDYQMRLTPAATRAELLYESAAHRALELARLTGYSVSHWQSALWFAQRWSLFGLGLWSALLALGPISMKPNELSDQKQQSQQVNLLSFLVPLSAIALSVLSWVALKI